MSNPTVRETGNVLLFSFPPNPLVYGFMLLPWRRWGAQLIRKRKTLVFAYTDLGSFKKRIHSQENISLCLNILAAEGGKYKGERK